MAEKIDLIKQVYSKENFNRVIDTSFPVEASSTTAATLSTLSVTEFFSMYDKLFYTIPKTGDQNSHEYLIKSSQAYIGNQQNSEEIDALIQEINGLRETVTQQQELIFNLTVSGSGNV